MKLNNMENKQIFKALIGFQSECPKLELNATVKVKTKTGGSYSFNYADLPYIMEIIQPILTKHELAVFFQISEMYINIVLAHISGETITSSLPIEISKNPQDNGSLITYYKRYLLTSVLNIVADQDDDANIKIGNDFKKDEGLPWLNTNTKQWNDTEKKLISGSVDLPTVKKHFRLSAKNEDILLSKIEAAIDEASKTN